jgi:hypothetical protein
MFIVQTEGEKTVTWPVVVEVAADGGKIIKYSFNGTFKVLNDDEREALLSKQAAEGGATSGAAADTAGEQQDEAKAFDPAEFNRKYKESQVDGIMAIMTGWTGVVDQNKQLIEFNRENLLIAARSKQGNSLLRGINTAIAEVTNGARAKN